MGLSVRALVFVLAVGVIAAVAGCGGRPEDVTPPPPGATASRDGVVVTLALDRSRPVAGTRSTGFVSVVNTSTDARFWQGGGCNDVASVTIDTAVEITPPLGRDWPGTAGQFKGLLLDRPQPSRQGVFLDARFVDQPHVMCPASLGVNTLGPGQRLEMRAIWSGDVNGAPAAAGPATVHASFPYLGPGPAVDPMDLSRRIVADMSVVVDGATARLLSPGEAIDAALGDPQFSAWVAAAGPMRMWDGVEIESPEGAYVVILLVGGQAGRATVDRVTGSVTFEQRPRS